MIPTVPAHLSSSAKETTEQVTSALKSLYTNAASSLQCGDGINLRLPSECSTSNRDADAVQLDWRSDDDTLSDLTLVIYDGSGGSPYHVHTLLLAFGGRKSGFVAEQLKQQQKKNIKEYKIEIYIPPLAAGYMPHFLDYIYGGVVQLTTDSAPSLRYLSNRFDVRELHAQISKFLPQDLELCTAPKYCMAADTLKDYELRDKALRIMAERMERMDCRYLKELSPRLMRSLVQSERMECGGVVLSEKIAQWIRVREDSTAVEASSAVVSPLSDEDFYWITHIQQMPQISHHEALFYLHYGSKYPSVMNEVGPGSLKHRCLVATSESSWAMDTLVAHLEHPDNVKMDLYQELDTDLKVQLLEGALVGAKKMGQEKAVHNSSQERLQRDVELSNEMMYENLSREQECPSVAKCKKVVVFGCGIGPANGVYMSDDAIILSQSSITSPQKNNIKSSKSGTALDSTYEKSAVWNGSRVTFLITPVKSGKYYTHYKLCVRRNNTTKVLYTSPTSTGSESIKASIPEYGWEVEGDGESVCVDSGGIYPAPVFVGSVGAGGCSAKA
ncbi:hypothetical protein ACHAXN_000786 [Cyclotella atomus]